MQLEADKKLTKDLQLLEKKKRDLQLKIFVTSLYYREKITFLNTIEMTLTPFFFEKYRDIFFFNTKYIEIS